MRTIAFFCLIGAAFAVPTETLVGKGFAQKLEGHVPLKSELTEEPQPVKTVNKIPIYGPQAINELNYDYVKVPYYPYFESYNKNYLNFYPTTGTSLGLPQYYPQFYPNKSYYNLKNYFGQYSPYYPMFGGKYANYGSQYFMPQYYKYMHHSTPFVGLGEKSGVTVPLTPLIL